MDKKRVNELLIRTVMALLYGGLFIGAIFWSKWSVGLLFALIMVVALIEFYSLCCKSNANPMKSIGVASALAIYGIAFTIFQQWGTPATETTGRIVLGLLLYVMLMVPAAFVCELWRKSPTPIANIATTFMGIIYVAVPMSMLLFVPHLLVGEWSAKAIMAYMFIIWANDIFAYLVGITLGRHRLCERISPKKSWEGFFGGVIGAVATALVAGHLFEGNLYIWGGLGIVASLTGVAGDLVESLMKRSADVKDSGKIMPGHGGILDRFDAVLLSVPFAVVYLLIVSAL